MNVCPFCQHQNLPKATVCTRCGEALAAKNAGSLTTVNVDVITHSAEGDKYCRDLLEALSLNTLALRIMDMEKPLLFEKPDHLILGRVAEDEESGEIINLTYLGKLALGVSRNHARLNFRDGSYTLEDLNSTNGTWVNRNKLIPGEAHILQSGDKIWIGPLKITVCFKQTVSTVEVRFQTTDHPLPSEEVLLTTPFFNQILVPYLAAVAEFSHVLATFQNKDHEPIIMNHLYIQDNQIYAEITHAENALEQILAWVIPWRRTHIQAEAETDIPKVEALAALAMDILRNSQQPPSEELDFIYVEKLIKPLTILTASELEPML